ncbi:MAG: SusE domain-containing protein [Chitinophagaceae bacterium]|nr:SusE domain-containing protein [Chitinophagaceae bacterium]
MNIRRIQAMLAAILLFGFIACEKIERLPFYAEGFNPELTASVTSLAPAPADSNKTVLTLVWANPEYASDSNSFKYIVQIDSAGRNFSKAVSFQLIGKRTMSFIAKDLNNLMLNYGFQYNRAYDLDFRVISSYGNNNERRTSNTLRIRATTYKIPPKVTLPSSGRLYIVGDATQGGWNNPMPVPSQELSRLDETTFGGIFQLNGGKQYLVLPLNNGDWSNKYSVASNALPGLAAGGNFGYNLPDNFPGPAANGLYKLLMDFQEGKFTVTPFTQQHGLPSELFIVGDATPGGWNNPVPVPAQRFTRINSTKFELTINLTAGKNYLFLPENGSGGKKYGAVDNQAPGIKNNGGPMKPEGQDMPSPDASGNYKITVDFMSNTYTLVKL